MKKEDLIEAFRDFTSTDFLSLWDTGAEEITRVLVQTRLLRLLMSKFKETPDSISVEIEVSFPSWMDSDNSNNQVNAGAKDDQSDLPDIIAEMIQHLKYLLRLGENGFTLSAIEQGCILTASKVYQNGPSSDELNLLLSYSQ